MDIRKWAEKYSIDCRLKYNSLATQENYISQVKSFLFYFKNEIEPKSIPNDKIKEWLLQAKTINTRKHRLCALNSFYLLTIRMPDKVSRIPYPKSDKKLPIVLSQDEIQRMFDVCENLKHKVILGILYSCGLRVSELINLKWAHIDRSRMIINIIQAKGKKDRQVALNKNIIPLLEKYWKEYKPKEYVLNGQNFPQYSERSVGEVIKQLATKAGIKKKVYTHLIRHCTFTHLVEIGCDINLVQKIAGHSSVKTTNLYLHISDNFISKMTNPINQIRL
jgi:site-specific recombinase XerD